MNNYLLPLLGDRGGQVIWAILLTNMGHITNQYGPYYSPTPNPIPERSSPTRSLSPREGGERLSHKAYKAYKSYKTYKS